MIDLTAARLFVGIRKDEAKAILAVAAKRKFRALEAIIRAEEAAAHLYIVKKGFVNFDIVTEKGHRILLRRFVPGNFFGIAAFLSEPSGYLGTATAVDDVEVLAWEHRSVLQLSSAYPRLSQNAFRLALHYIAIYAQRHVRLVSNTAQERMAYALTDIASRAGHAMEAGVEVEIRNEDLASLADVSFFTATRLLKDWERVGAVAKKRGRVLIRCPEKLLAEEVADSEESMSVYPRARKAAGI